MSTTGHGHGHGHGGEGASVESVAAGFEVSDWQMRPVAILTIATIGILILAFIAMAGLLLVSGGSLADTSNAPSATQVARLPPQPRLEQNPNVDGERIVAEATELLESYGWTNQGAGTAHVPIERAMDLLLEQGINPFPAAQP